MSEEQILGIINKISKPEEIKHTLFEPKTFKGAASYAWINLGFTDNVPHITVFEDFLIELIEKCYLSKENISKKDAFKRDCSLLMFGLLRGYYHTNIETGSYVPLKDRYEAYLNKSDFVSRDYPGEGTYENIASKDKQSPSRKKNAQPRPLNKLTRTATDCKQELSKLLYESLQNGSYKEYLREYNPEKEKGRPSNLPEPIYTLDNFPIQVAPDLKTTNDQENTQPNENIEENAKDTSSNELAFSIEDHADSEATSAPSRIPHGSTSTVSDDTETDALLKKYLHDIHKLTPYSQALMSYSRTLCVAVIILIIVLVLDRIMYTAKSSQIPEMPVIESDAMKNAEVIAELARPRIEDFKLKDDKLSLIPGETKNLKEIMDLSPPDGNMLSLSYTSSNEEIVNVEHGYVTASENIEEGMHHIYVNITALNGKKDIVHIKVENLPILDDSMPQKGGGIQKE